MNQEVCNSPTTGDIELNPCEIDECRRFSATLCRHCKKNVCRHHFIEHADQLVQDLNPLWDNTDNLLEKVDSVDVYAFKKTAHDTLKQWRDNAIKNINDLYEYKKAKLDLLLCENEKVFAEQRTDHLKVLNTLRSCTQTHIIEQDITYEELLILQRKFQALKDRVNETHNHLVYCNVKPILTDYTWALLHSTGNNFMSGGTLLHADYQMKLNEFYGNPTQKWQLLYKATKDGFGAQDFHRCVDDKGPTITVIQAGAGNSLFGGYVQISWGSDNKYKVDSSAFIFTLTNPHGIQPTKFFQNPKCCFAVGHAGMMGPFFGGVVQDEKHFIDFEIVSDAQENENSHSNFPASYLDTTGKGEILFTGAKYFTVQEIEVYTPCSPPNDDDKGIKENETESSDDDKNDSDEE